MYGSVSPLPYPLPESLDESNIASHVVLHVFPMYSKDSLGVDVGPKVIVIEAAYVDFLLQGEQRAAVVAHHRQSAPTTERMDFMGQARELRGETEYQASGCIDLAVEVGGKLLEKVLRTIAACLRYESTKSGISLLFSGSVNKVFPSEYASQCGYSCDVIAWPDSEAIQSYAAALVRSQATIDELYFESIAFNEDSCDELAVEARDNDLAHEVDLPTSHQNMEKSRIWKHKLSAESNGSSTNGDAMESVPVVDAMEVHHKHAVVSKEIQTLIGLIAPDAMHRENQRHQQSHNQMNLTHTAHPHKSDHQLDHKSVTTNHHRITIPGPGLGHAPVDRSDDLFELRSCRYIHGSLISFCGRFLPEELPIVGDDSDSYGSTSQVILLVTASLQGIECFPTADVNIGPEYLQYLFSSLDPPHIPQYVARGSGDPDDEIDLEIQHMWRCIVEDESLQQRMFSSACDHLTVNVSRELKRIDIQHAFADSMLC